MPRQVEGHQVTAGDASLSAAERLEVRKLCMSDLHLSGSLSGRQWHTVAWSPWSAPLACGLC